MRPAEVRHAEETVEDVGERRHTVQVVQYDDGRHSRPGCSDVIAGSDVRAALVGEVVEILSQFAARLTVDLEDGYQVRRPTSIHVVRPETHGRPRSLTHPTSSRLIVVLINSVKVLRPT